MKWTDEMERAFAAQEAAVVGDHAPAMPVNQANEE
jgi:hypothetical protein